MKSDYSAFYSAKFVVGRGSLSFLKQLGKRRAAVVFDGRVINEEIREKIRSFVEQGGGECLFVADIRNEPYFGDIMRATKELASFEPDEIIAIGGGSVMDTAKAMHLFYEHPNLKIEDTLKPYSLPELGEKAILVAIPTTSGTGSETTSAAVFIDEATKSKHLMLSNTIIPAYAILDADFTDSLPSVIAAHTGMDALTHAMEAAVCVTSSVMVVSIALGAALDLIENLKDSVLCSDGWPHKAQAREACHVAASLAGMVITNSCAGLAHGLDQPGPFFGLPHGMICGLMLPYTTAFTSPHPSYEKLARRLGLKGSGGAELCQALVDYLWEYNREVGIPHSFKELGVDEKAYMDKLDDFTQLAMGAVATKLSPRVPTHTEAREILYQAYYGNHPLVGKP